MIRKLVQVLRERAREKRRKTFLERFKISANTKVLDLGANDGSYIALVLKDMNIMPSNVYIADINQEALKKGHSKYGFSPVLLREFENLPFEDKFFDIVFCSSVIEHITVPKEQKWKIWSEKEFNAQALAKQEQFSREIRRVGKGYFVQTPNKWFVIESHTWLPFVGYLPRWLLIPVLHITNSFWIKGTSPDWRLLTKNGMKSFFPEGELIEEKWLGMTKSIISIKDLK